MQMMVYHLSVESVVAVSTHHSPAFKLLHHLRSGVDRRYDISTGTIPAYTAAVKKCDIVRESDVKHDR